MNFSKILNKKILIVIFISIFFLPGCRVWNNFTTYFNLYYNITDLFSQAEKIISEQKKDLFAINDPYIPPQANPLLNKVVEKCSRLLQFHTNSSYVDDALLIIGKSFYYQQNYVKAYRKFQELILTQEDSDLFFEAELWAAKTEMRMKNFTDGLASLELIRQKAIQEKEPLFLREVYLELIRYYVHIKNTELAIDYCNQFINVSTNKEINAEVAFERGKLYLAMNDYENAIKSFEEVNKYSPTFDIEFSAAVERGAALRNLGNEEEAFNIYLSLKNQQKYIDQLDIIELELGNSHRSLKRYEEAYKSYKYVDTAFANTTTAGTARFKLGELFEYYLIDFDSAAFYYRRSVESATPIEYLTKARIKNTLFAKYKNISAELNDYKKQLLYSRDERAFLRDSIAFVRDTSTVTDEDIAKLFEIKDETEIDSNEFENQTTLTQPEDENNKEGQIVLDNKNQNQFNNQQFQQQGGEIKIPPRRPTISEDSIIVILAKNSLELANLFFVEFNLGDSAYYHYTQILEKYPSQRFIGSTLYGLAIYYESEGNRTKSDSLYNVIYENFRTEQVVNAAATKLNKPLIDIDFDPAEEDYITAENLLLENEYHKSVTSFLTIPKMHPTSPFAPKALYTSGWILENKLLLLDSAAVVYDSVLTKYPQTVYASTVRPKVSFYKQEKERIRIAKEDSLRKIQEEINKQKAKEDSIKNAKLNPVVQDSVKIKKEETQKNDSEDEYEDKKEEESGEEKDDKEGGDEFSNIILRGKGFSSYKNNFTLNYLSLIKRS